MFLKQIEPSFDHFDSSVSLIKADGFVKSAETDENVQRFVDQYLKANKKPNHFYLHINAMGAGEFYGSNRNGDYFPEDNLLRYYKTFEQGHLFRHHQNRDPQRASGKVIASFYNDRMHRVELIVEVPRELGGDLESRINAGDMPWTSMATKTPYDSCSICGNQATSRMEYCDHLTNHMNELRDDGSKVFAINDGPLRFFDISVVVKPADPTSGVLEKVAYAMVPHTPLQDAAFRLETRDSPLKEMAIHKADEILRMRPDIPFDIAYPPEDVLPMLRGCNPSELSNLYAETGIHPPVDFTMRVLLPELSPRLAELGASFLPLQNSVMGMGAPVPSIGFLKSSEDRKAYLLKSAAYCSTSPEMLEKRAFFGTGIPSQEGYFPYYAQNPYAAPIFYPGQGDSQQQQPMPLVSASQKGILPTLIGMASMALMINAFAHALASHRDREEESRLGMALQAKKLQEQQAELLKHLRDPELKKKASYNAFLEALPLPDKIKDALEVPHRVNEIDEDVTSTKQSLRKQALFGLGEAETGVVHALEDNPVLRAESRPYSTTPPAAVAAETGGSEGAGQGFSFASTAMKHVNPVAKDLIGG